MTLKFLLLTACALAVNSYKIEVKQFENGAHYLLKSSANANTDWWKTAVFYQIYPRSFMDSNGDGIGDLKGIISKLNYLNETGITAVWLSPIFKSPQVDQGYDISDYRDVDSDYGSLEDLKELISQAKKLGIKIILDFVPNHTSHQHEWFVKSANKTKGYENYYIWKDGKDVGDGTKTVPNNWISNFKGSAWTFHEGRGQYYYHQFAPEQPDLNYREAAVVEAMKDVLKYWLDIGVDGFRIDAVPFLYEDEQFRDEELAPGYTEYNANNFNCLDHRYTQNLQDTFEMIYEFRKVLDNYTKTHSVDTRIMMTEAYAPIEQQMLYYGTSNSSKLGAHFTFNFNFITTLTNKAFTIDDIFNSIEKWLVYMPKQYTNNWVLGNHDNHRVATRFGKENVDGFNMLNAILPGVMVTYNGEEIGMEDGEVTCRQGKDPQAIKDCNTFAQVSRDFERTPFQWDNTTKAGFTTGTPWLPVSTKAKEVNLAAQKENGISSHYKIYKDLLKFRKNFQKKISFDALSVIKLSNNVLQILRHVDDDEYSLIFNIGSTNATVELYKTKGRYVVLVSSVGSSYKVGDVVNKLTLQPHESLIVESEDIPTTTTARVSSTTKGGSTTIRASQVSICLLLFALYKLIMPY